MFDVLIIKVSNHAMIVFQLYALLKIFWFFVY